MGEVVSINARGRTNPTLDWDTDQASAERYLRRFPHMAGMSDIEITRAAARLVARRRETRTEIGRDRA